MPVILYNTREYQLYEKDVEGRVHIKRHAYFKLSCNERFFRLTEMMYKKEIVVQCVQENALMYEGLLYLYEDFECSTRERPTEKPVTITPPKINNKNGKYIIYYDLQTNFYQLLRNNIYFYK